MGVPLFDTWTPLAPLRERLREAVDTVLDSRQFILGPQVATFEAEFAAYCGAAHGIGVANGTEAITIALRAMGVGDGDEVVVPSFTFYASAEAIPPTGATPVFCDIDPETYCVTAETVRAALTPRTKAVIAVHLFGNLAPVSEIEALGVPVLEDAAQAAGSRSEAGRAGALGTAATFSFFPSKNLGCFGDGGAVVTNRADVAERVRKLRNHGSVKRSVHSMGYNSRLDDLQAAVLSVKLKQLDRWNDQRRAFAAQFDEGLKDTSLKLPYALPGYRHIYHLYVVETEQRDNLQAYLNARGITALTHYPIAIHQQEGYPWGQGARIVGSLKHSEESAAHVLSLPMFPELTGEEVQAVIEAVVAWDKKLSH